MPMNYSPDEKVDRPNAEPGEYVFKIDDAQETVFRSGNEGCKLTLLVGALPNRDVTVFDNLVYVGKALWKTEQLMKSIGLDFYRPPEVHELVGKMGKAKFMTGEKGYLEVEEYLPASANNAPGASQFQAAPAQEGADDDVPF